MSEQQKVMLDKNGKVKGNSKGEAGHPDFTVDFMTLILARQRCIESINGKQVRAMYNRLAALGATIIENRSGNNTGKFETALMQRTGHAVRSETKKFIELIVNNRKNGSKLVFIPNSRRCSSAGKHRESCERSRRRTFYLPQRR